MRLPEPPIGRERQEVPIVLGVELRRCEDVVKRGTRVALLPLRPSLALNSEDSIGERMGRVKVRRRHLRAREIDAVDLASEDAPLLAEVDLVPRGERPTPVKDDRVDARSRHQRPISATISSTAASTATVRRSPERRSLISMVPSARPCPR